ncbi:MAG TPA: hypothetical protein ENJ29_04700 [Bacteroidetes bacterium]|nr:hypothetical protein [Bacteroidota bacterium]
MHTWKPARVLGVSCVALAMLLIASAGFAQLKMKKRIAVFDFTDKTNTTIAWWYGGSTGRGMADMLITELVKSGKYTVIERTQIEQVMKEQMLGMTGAVTPETAAKAGKLLGVDIAVIGSVTEFGHSKGGVGGRLKGIGLGVKSQKATVAMDVRLVNTTTGEILAAENVRKEKSKKGVSFDKWGSGISFNSRNDFDQSIIGKATRDAIKEIVKLLDKTARNLKWQGKVVKATATSVIINAGSAQGVKAGDKFVILRAGEELIDPDTGLSLGSTEEEIGVIQVVNAGLGNGRASQCKIISGRGFQRGDIVREK